MNGKQNEMQQLLNRIESVKGDMKKMAKMLNEIEAEREWVFDQVRRNPQANTAAAEYLAKPETGAHS